MGERLLYSMAANAGARKFRTGGSGRVVFCYAGRIVSQLRKVISGGQTGVDQAALRAARDCGLKIGGWCPPGRTCEAGVIPVEFPLEETEQERSVGGPAESASPGIGDRSYQLLRGVFEL
jgi:hypothetical protein